MPWIVDDWYLFGGSLIAAHLVGHRDAHGKHELKHACDANGRPKLRSDGER
jgi:hypothetical protein